MGLLNWELHILWLAGLEILGVTLYGYPYRLFCGNTLKFPIKSEEKQIPIIFFLGSLFRALCLLMKIREIHRRAKAQARCQAGHDVALVGERQAHRV